MRSYPILILLFFCAVVTASSLHGQAITAPGSPFQAFLQSSGNDVEELGIKQDSIITLRRIKFSSRKGANKIYGIVAAPAGAGRFPAILVFHGGSSYADELQQFIRSYAAKGYVAMAIDLPGICDPDKATLSEGSWRNRFKDPNARFDVAQALTNSTLTDAVIASLEAFNMLAAMNNVDRRHMGITGFSWGGYMTTMLSGLLGSRVHAAYSVFGCGFYEKGSKWKEQLAAMPAQQRLDWLRYFDAGRAAPGIRCSYFIEESVNDEYFWPAAVMATLDMISAEKNLTWGPNLDHKRLSAGENMQQYYFDYYLKSKGRPFGKVKIIRTNQNADNSKDVLAKVSMPKGVNTDIVLLYYAEKKTARVSKIWKSLKAISAGGNKYKVTIPADIVSKDINYYICVVDSRNIHISTYMK